VPQVAWLEEPTARASSTNSRATFARRPGVADAELPACRRDGIASVEKGQIVYGLPPPSLARRRRRIRQGNPGLPGNDPFVQLVENLTLVPAGIRADASGVLVAAEKNEPSTPRRAVSGRLGHGDRLARRNDSAPVRSRPARAPESNFAELVTAALTAKGVTGVGPDRKADAVSKAASGPVDIVVKKGKRPTPPEK
jgi:hypothetical protein